MNDEKLREIAEIERTISGETLAGMQVAGYRWRSAASDSYTYSYASHWSTGPARAKRLYAEADVLSLLDRALAAEGERDEARATVEQLQRQLSYSASLNQ